MKKKTFNILGVCVLRDVFSHHDNDGGYTIQQYVSAFPPLFSFEKGIDIDIDQYAMIDMTGISSNFIKRCILFNINGGVFDYISRKKSDYLLIDVALTRTQYFVLENNQYCYGGYKEVYDLMKEKGLFPAIKETKPFDFLDKNEIKLRIKKYCAKIKELYDVSKIVLFEVRNAVLLYDNIKNEIEPFSLSVIKKAYQQNEFMDYCFSIAKQELKGCHIVYMPRNVVCDTHHPLKKRINALHTRIL